MVSALPLGTLALCCALWSVVFMAYATPRLPTYQVHSLPFRSQQLVAYELTTLHFCTCILICRWIQLSFMLQGAPPPPPPETQEGSASGTLWVLPRPS